MNYFGANDIGDGERRGVKTLSFPACYEIILQGPADKRWADWFDGLVLEALPGDQVRLSGWLPDQPALHGLLERIRDLNLALLLVRRMPEGE